MYHNQTTSWFFLIDQFPHLQIKRDWSPVSRLPKIGRFCFDVSLSGVILTQDAQGLGVPPQQKEDLQQQACVSADFLLKASRSPGRQQAKPGKRKGKGGKRAGSRAGGRAGEWKWLLEAAEAWLPWGFWVVDRIASWWLQRLKVVYVGKCSLPPDSRLPSALPSQWINPPRNSNVSRQLGDGTMSEVWREAVGQWPSLAGVYLVPSGAITVFYGSCLPWDE